MEMVVREVESMKRCVAFILVLAQCCFLAGCIHESKQLLSEDAFWWMDREQTNKRCSVLFDMGMFPNPEIGPAITDYYFKVEHGIHNDSIQLYMQCKYTEEHYFIEKERLLSSEFSCSYRTKQGESDYSFECAKYYASGYKYPAVIVAMVDGRGCEYALLDENEQRIIYILLQFIELSDVQFDYSHLPLDEKGGPTTLYEN